MQKRPMGPIIRDVIDVYQSKAADRGVRIELNWPETLPPINVDPGMMGQVLHNLVKNSMDAINGAGNVTITGEAGDGALVITISDSGTGMDEAVRARVFEPFYTTKGLGGTGLGMPIVKTIVDAHRGTIDCISASGEGTTFVIRLPLN